MSEGTLFDVGAADKANDVCFFKSAAQSRRDKLKRRLLWNFTNYAEDKLAGLPVGRDEDWLTPTFEEVRRLFCAKIEMYYDESVMMGRISPYFYTDEFSDDCEIAGLEAPYLRRKLEAKEWV